MNHGLRFVKLIATTLAMVNMLSGLETATGIKFTGNEKVEISYIDEDVSSTELSEISKWGVGWSGFHWMKEMDFDKLNMCKDITLCFSVSDKLLLQEGFGGNADYTVDYQGGEGDTGDIEVESGIVAKIPYKPIFVAKITGITPGKITGVLRIKSNAGSSGLAIKVNWKNVLCTPKVKDLSKIKDKGALLYDYASGWEDSIKFGTLEVEESKSYLVEIPSYVKFDDIKCSNGGNRPGYWCAYLEYMKINNKHILKITGDRPGYGSCMLSFSKNDVCVTTPIKMEGTVVLKKESE